MLNDVREVSRYSSISQYLESSPPAQQLSFSDEQLLLHETEAAIIFFLESGRPVYIDSVGILFPKVASLPRIKIFPNRFVVSTDKVRIFDFEKSSELIRLHRERFAGITEIKEIAQRVYRSVARFLTIEAAYSTVLGFIKKLYAKLALDIIHNGQSSLFSSIGDFYALHNRQGDTVKDWFAGADIFLKSRYQAHLLTTQTLSFERPVLRTAFEPFESIHGEPLAVTTIEIVDALKQFGYALSEEDIKNVVAPSFGIGVFVDPVAKNLIFVTDGLRKIGIFHPSGQQKGTEFIIQTPFSVAAVFGEQEMNRISKKDVPEWPKMLLTLAWILLQSSKTGTSKPGAMMSFEDTPLSFFGTQCTSMLVTNYQKISSEQLTSEGPFEYDSLVVLTKEEELFARQYSNKLLLTFLEYKKNDQYVPLARQSVIARSSFVGQKK